MDLKIPEISKIPNIHNKPVVFDSIVVVFLRNEKLCASWKNT